MRIAFARAATLKGILREFAPDVIHLASPFVLGWQGVAAADGLEWRHWGRGVDTELFTPERRSEAWRARIAPGETVIGYVGRLAPEKQVEDLSALADLPGTRLVIVGDGPSRPALERALPGAVFTGRLGGPALAEALAGFDVFVHPGESETFGQTIQEALASGVPVVATGVGGPVDLVRSSVDGWLYRPGDLGDLRARVADLVGDESKRRAFAHAAHASVRERSWDVVCRALLAHYDEARALRSIDDRRVARGAIRPSLPSSPRRRRAGHGTWRSATRSPRGCATPRVSLRGSIAAGPIDSRSCSRCRSRTISRSTMRTSPCAAGACVTSGASSCLGRACCNPTSCPF